MSVRYEAVEDVFGGFSPVETFMMKEAGKKKKIKIKNNKKFEKKIKEMEEGAEFI